MYGKRGASADPGRSSSSSSAGLAPGRRTLTGVLQRKAAPAAESIAPAPSGGGAALPRPVLTQMNDAFGTDFSAVRVHEGDRVPAVGALAYAQGADVHFAPGQYDRGSTRGTELIGHELAHVVQQSQGRVAAGPLAKGAAINEDPALEREADEMGARAARGESVGAPAGPIAAGGSAVQLYREEDGHRISENDLYMVDLGDPTRLLVHDDAAPPTGDLIIADGGDAPDGYQGYHYDPDADFENDCLGLAENLARNIDQPSGRAEFRAVGDQGRETGRLFGHTDATNTSIASGAWGTDELANPDIGEAYSTARTRIVPDEVPYHAATVVAKDGGDNVTLEADAGDPDLAVPVFDMYGTRTGDEMDADDDPQQTFHDRYRGMYSTRGAPAHTGVLRLRDD
jgi:hypothetical protein